MCGTLAARQGTDSQLVLTCLLETALHSFTEGCIKEEQAQVGVGPKVLRQSQQAKEDFELAVTGTMVSLKKMY